jgi:hypothetical protein
MPTSIAQFAATEHHGSAKASAIERRDPAAVLVAGPLRLWAQHPSYTSGCGFDDPPRVCGRAEPQDWPRSRL